MSYHVHAYVNIMFEEKCRQGTSMCLINIGRNYKANVPKVIRNERNTLQNERTHINSQNACPYK